MKELTSTIRSRAGILSLGALLPLLLVLTIEDVPRFVFADCPYYSCDETNEYFKAVADPGEISLYETSSLVALNAACPCSWEITSQPGGWTIDDHGDCTATLRPINEFGSAGDITVLVTSDECQDTVMVRAGCFNFQVQASLDGGATWQSEVFIEGNPGLSVDLPVRTVMTATTGETDGWSYSIKHSAATLEANGGDIQVTATIADTQAATLEPWWDETEVRVDAGQSLIGYTQAVVIDDNLDAWLAPTVGFVTSAACYSITMPSEGFYQVNVSLADDVGDGRPPIQTLIGQDNENIYPCFRDLTIHIESSTTVTHPTLTCDEVTYVNPLEDGGPGPGGPKKNASRRTKGPPRDPPPGQEGDFMVLPVSCADADANGTVQLTDAIRVLHALFLGGKRVKRPALLKTGVTQCFGDGFGGGGKLATCPTSSGIEFFGQDGNFRKGLVRSYQTVDPNDDGNSFAILDLQTGLMWKRNPDFTLFGDFDTAQGQAGSSFHEGESDWRTPTVWEILSIVNFRDEFCSASQVETRCDDGLDNDGDGLVDCEDIADCEEIEGGSCEERRREKQCNNGADDDLDGEVDCDDNDCGGNSRLAPPAFDLNFFFFSGLDLAWTSTTYALDNNKAWVIDAQGSLSVLEKTASDPRTDLQVRDADLDFSGDRVLSGPPAPLDLEDLGDANGDKALNITDAIFILEFLFQGGTKPCVVLPGINYDSFPVGRFQEVVLPSGQEAVTDTFTNLMWLKEPRTFTDWETALSDAEGPFGNPPTSGWRLPNAFELASLVDFAKPTTPVFPGPFVLFSINSDPPCLPEDFESECRHFNCPSGCEFPLWTSTTSGTDPAFAWHVTVNDRLYTEFDVENSEFVPGIAGFLGPRTDSFDWPFGRKIVDEFAETFTECWVLPVRDR